VSTENFAALRDFRNRWRHIADERMRELERFVLSAEVTYNSLVLDGGEVSKVTINCQSGPDDGKISIEETGCLVLDYVHLDFSPDFQDFEFNEDSGALVVSGSSKKMRGSYEVVIQPEGSVEDD
jgi:hypothetical protein